ncbi:MAG: asparagine synthase-related protein [Candidatus Competibacteraceae bacterium]
MDSSLLVGFDGGSRGQQLEHIRWVSSRWAAKRATRFKYSDIIAQHFGTTHQIRVSSSELLEQLPNAISAMSGEPMVSHDCIGFYLLSREVAKTCKAVQSGQGADEVFGGYHWYPPLIDSAAPFESYRQAFFDRDFAEYQQVVQARLVEADHAGAFVQNHFAQPGANDPVDKALRLDTTVMLVDDPVKRVDNMTMAWGLEARVPFLDHELVQFAARMPSGLKVANEGKYILKETARAVIPSAVIDRPKGYFPVPALKYLQGSVLDYVRDALLNPQAQQRGLFQQDYVNHLLDDPESHITPLRGSKLWQLGLLEIWLQAQGL